MATTPLVLTSGEPAGIGPDLLVNIAQQASAVPLVVIADPDLLTSRAVALGLPLHLQPYRVGQVTPQPAGSLCVLASRLMTKVQPGQVNPVNAPYVVHMLERAATGCLAGEFAGMVTAPVHKAVLNQAGIAFSGHTEWLAQRTGRQQVVMLLATQQLRVALVTTHLPLAQVPQHITEKRLTRVIRVLEQGLKQQFGIAQPKIWVCGLNPHAGEAGYLGREEIDVINPTLDRLRQQGVDLTGPLPADSLFASPTLDQADSVLAMYHDQGLPVLKYQGFGQAVNVTLGLPFVRVSVDHGTALELAGSGAANCSSLLAAIKMAEQLAYSNGYNADGPI
jgi:4-hydroxythreonine-4-phosphate dehydrogenase